jgi:hypothetical protein
VLGLAQIDSRINLPTRTAPASSSFIIEKQAAALGYEASTMFALEATTRVMLDVTVLAVDNRGQRNLGTATANICHFRERSTLSYQIDAKISHADALAPKDCRSKPVPRCQAHLHSRWLTRPPFASHVYQKILHLVDIITITTDSALQLASLI